ncbi:MAG: RimK family alpha-L-glutamate ligase [Candidatus Methylomirabilales bacterium]
MTRQHVRSQDRRLAIFYEHPEWFGPLFAELDRRGVGYDRLLASRHRFDPAERHCPYALVVNRMSPSAYTRGHAQAVFYTLQYLAYLKEIGANVLNGYDAYVYEFSKARQLSLFARLGLRSPRARVINHPSEAPAAAEGLTFPVLVKPNIGGSGAKIVRVNTLGELRMAVEAGGIDLGIDHTALVQEYLPAEGNSIVRVEVLNGTYLYAIRLFLTPEEFNLCPADYCRLPEPEGRPGRGGLADGVSGRGVPVEGCTPPPRVIEDVKRITAAAQIEVGGVEYLVNARDGQVYYYDVNALSNFVADAPRVVGFDPFPRLVDYLLLRAGLSEPAAV